MTTIQIMLCGRQIHSGCYLSGQFPLEEFEAKIEEVGMDYLRRTHRVQEGLTWKDVMKIPDYMWEEHGVHKPTSDRDYVNAIAVYKLEDAYLIPSKEARLMEVASKMTLLLMDILDQEVLEQSPNGLREKISGFVLIWAPRFVDFENGDLRKFTEQALEQSSSYDWEVIEEEEKLDPYELGCEARFI